MYGDSRENLLEILTAYFFLSLISSVCGMTQRHPPLIQRVQRISSANREIQRPYPLNINGQRKRLQRLFSANTACTARVSFVRIQQHRNRRPYTNKTQEAPATGTRKQKTTGARMTVSTENATFPKCTKSRSSNYPVSRSMKFNLRLWFFECVPRNLCFAPWWILGVVAI